MLKENQMPFTGAMCVYEYKPKKLYATQHAYLYKQTHKGRQRRKKMNGTCSQILKSYMRYYQYEGVLSCS